MFLSVILGNKKYWRRQLATYSNNKFVGQRIQIDGHVFEKNEFENCVLVYGGGPLSFSNNELRGVQW
jgi:hypothetical protein